MSHGSSTSGTDLGGLRIGSVSARAHRSWLQCTRVLAGRCPDERLYKGDAELDRSIELDPRSDVAYQNRGWALEEAGRIDAHFRDYDKAIELDPPTLGHIAQRAKVLDRLGRSAESGTDRAYCSAGQKYIGLPARRSASRSNPNMELQNNYARYELLPKLPPSAAAHLWFALTAK